MLDKVIHFSLKQRLIILTSAVFLLAFGFWAIPKMPIDVFPPLGKPVVTILANAPGYDALEVEKLITLPIESSLTGAPGASIVRSISKQGLSQVIVQFNWGTNIYIDREVVTEKLQTIQGELPPGVVPELNPISSVFGVIMILSVHSKTGATSPMKLRTLATWVIKRRLMTIPGIASIPVLGGDVKQYQVLVNPHLLKFYHVSLTQVAQAAKNTNKNSSGGFLQSSDRQFLIQNIGRTDRISSIKRGVVTYRDGVPIEIRDLAKVKIGPKLIKIGSAMFAQDPFNSHSPADSASSAQSGRIVPTRAVEMVIVRQPGINTVNLVHKIKKELKSIQGSLPSDVSVTPVYNQSRFINMAIKNVRQAVIEGGIIILAVVAFFLFNVQATLIVFLAIPISFITALLVLKHEGITINTMTLGGLAIVIGIVIDDAIINVENIFRRLRENHHSESPKPIFDVVYEASKEVQNSIVYATFVIALVFVPLFFLPGMSGRLFVPLSLTYVISLLASLIVSLTISPVLSYYLLPKAKAVLTEKDPFFSFWLKNQYEKLLRKVLSFPWPVLGLTLLCFLAAAFYFPFIGKEYLPKFNEGAVLVHIHAGPLTSVPEMDRIVALAEKTLLKNVPEMKKIGAKIGRAKVMTVDPIYHAELDAELSPSGRTIGEIKREIRKKLAVIPGVKIILGQRIFEQMNNILTGTRGQIVVKLFGHSLSVLREVGRKIYQTVKNVPGTKGAYIEPQALVSQLQIKVKRRTAARLGLTPAQINRDLQLALRGDVVSRILEGSRTFGLFVGYGDRYRNSLHAVRNTLLELPDGSQIPVKTVAEIHFVKNPNLIYHDDVQRRIAISCNSASGAAPSAVVSAIRKAIAAKVKIPQGYYLKYEGQFKEQQKASRLILFFSLIVLIAIFVILVSHFKMSRFALQIMANIPLALIGGVAAVLISGIRIHSGHFSLHPILSISSLLGFITVGGIVTRNGIMLISHYLHLIEKEGESFNLNLVVRGAKERLIPILMTALAAAFGVLPFAIARGQIGKEILQPMCVVILGGIISATFLNLLVTPVLFWLFGSRAEEMLKQEAYLKSEPVLAQQ
jgi:CzcA family heavy metal efflux pump